MRRYFQLIFILLTTALFFIPAAAADKEAPLAAPQSPEVQALLQEARQLENLERTTRAAERYTQAIMLNPLCKEAWAGLGWIHLHEKNYRQAIRDFTTVIDLSSDSPEGYGGRGQAYQLTKRYKAAIKDYSRVIELTPDSGDYFYRRGQVYYLLDDVERTASDFKKAVAKGVENPLLFSMLANLYLKENKPQNAVKMAAKAIEMGPDNGLNYAIRAEAYFRLRKADETIEDVNSALERDQKNAFLFYMRGFSWMQRKDFEKARQDFIFTQELDPDWTQPLIALAIMEFFYENKYEQAIEYIKQAYATEPQAVYVRNLLCMMVSECPVESLNDGKLAVEIADTLNVEPGDYATLGIKASAYARNGQYDMAVKYQSKSVEFFEKDTFYKTNRPEIYRYLFERCHGKLELFKKSLPCNRPFSAKLVSAVYFGEF